MDQDQDHGRVRVAVVGAGIIGLSTAYTLSMAGASVRVYEHGTPGAAQSGGQTRLFRHNHQDPRLVAMARRSRAAWARWEQEFGVELVSTAGSIVLGPTAEVAWARLSENRVRARWLDPAELHDRLPVLAAYDGPALLDQDAGAIRVAAAISALVAHMGDRLITEEVLTIAPTPHGTVEVRSSGGRAQFDRVVVCAGADTARLAQRAGVHIPVSTSVHVRGTFALRTPRRATPTTGPHVAGYEPVPAGMACVQDGGAFTDTSAYGAPVPDGSAYAVGISHASDGDGSDPTALVTAVDRTSAYVTEAMPGLDPEPVALRHCRVTTLPWGSDGIGVWEHEGAFYLVGHNLFKHAPALGEALARTALGHSLDVELGPSSRLGGIAR